MDTDEGQGAAARIAEAIQKTREIGGGEPLVHVARLAGGVPAHLGALSPEAADEEGLLSRFGGGTFRVQVKDPVSKRIAAQADFVIHGAPRLDAATAPTPPAASAPAPDGLAAVAALLERQTATLAALVETVRAPAAPAASAPLGPGGLSFREVLEMARELRGGGGSPTNGLGLTDLLTLLREFKPQVDGAKTPLKESLEGLRLLRELSSELGGEPKPATEADSLGDLARELLPAIVDALRDRKDGKKTRREPLPLKKEVITVRPEDVEEVEALGLSEKLVLSYLKGNAAELVEMAKTRPAGEAALEVFGVIPPAGYDLIRREDAPDLMAREIPALAPYKVWLADLRAALLEILDGDDDPAPEPEKKKPTGKRKKKA